MAIALQKTNKYRGNNKGTNRGPKPISEKEYREKVRLWELVKKLNQKEINESGLPEPNLNRYSGCERYWFDLDAVRIPHKKESIKRNRYGLSSYPEKMAARNRELKPGDFLHPLGKNLGDVWSISVQGFKESHFATFPEDLIKPLIEVACPQWICKKCGKIRRRIIERNVLEYKAKPYNAGTKFIHHGEGKSTLNNSLVLRYMTGWTDCGCGAGWEAGVVLDPFAGRGTVGIVAEKLGRNSILIDLNKDYCEMAYRGLKPLVAQKKLTGEESIIEKIGF